MNILLLGRGKTGSLVGEVARHRGHDIRVAGAAENAEGSELTEEKLNGIDAVIDKDYAAQRLAGSLLAEALVLVTGVETVMLDFGTPGQRAVEEMTVEEAERHLADGQFPPGSMGPKVRAATRFLRAGGRVAVITTPELVYPSLEGRASLLEGTGGTSIVRDARASSGGAVGTSALVGP